MPDSDLLPRALELARLALGRTSPNPTVGCVLAHGSEIVGEGFHLYSQLDHAEIVALRQAGPRAKGATAFLTLEPCSHSGRTPPCADALIHAGVARVVCAMQDPNPLVSGSGLSRLIAAGIPASVDPRYTADAEQLNEPFVHAMRTGLPLVTLKCAVTLDGKIAAPEDNTGWITSDQARIHVQRVRHLHDAVVTGIGTVLADDPLLTDRSGLERSRPFLRVVLDSQLRIPLASRLVESAASDLLIVCNPVASAARRAALQARGVRVETLAGPSGRTSIPDLVRLLAREHYRSVMIEGGAKINWAALESNAVDKVFLYYAPKILGGLESLPMAGGIGRRSRSDAIRLRDVRLHPISKDEFAVEAYIRKGD